jgi:hypothetical protein
MASSDDELKINAKMFEEWPVWAGEWDEGYSPVFHYDPLPEDLGNLLVKVEFVTPGGVRLAGCVSTPARHFAVVFVGREGFSFNRRMRPPDEKIARLNQLVPELRGQIFPLSI